MQVAHLSIICQPNDKMSIVVVECEGKNIHLSIIYQPNDKMSIVVVECEGKNICKNFPWQWTFKVQRWSFQ
jgi:hypothetical protein